LHPPIAKKHSNLELVYETDLTLTDSNISNAKEFLTEVFSRNLISSRQLSKEFSLRFGTPMLDITAIDKSMIPIYCAQTHQKYSK